MYATVVPELEEGELEKVMNPIIQEYFEHGDTKEVEVRFSHMLLHVAGGVESLADAAFYSLLKICYTVKRLQHCKCGILCCGACSIVVFTVKPV